MYSAYEIATFHKREPPPKEILEDVSAKGGDLLNRTLENYAPRASREAENLANGDRSDSEDEHNTPKDGDKMDIDEPGSTGGRVTRGMCCHKLREGLCCCRAGIEQDYFQSQLVLTRPAEQDQRV